MFERDNAPAEDDSVDMKEVDGFLGQMGVMLARWSNYTRFVAAKCAVWSLLYLTPDYVSR